MSATTPPIKAFLFDLGGVLLRVDSSESVRSLGEILDRSPEEVQSAMSKDLLFAYERGELSSKAFYEELQNRCDPDRRLDEATFKRYWQDVLFPMDDMIDFLDRVRQRYPVWFLSNTNDYHYDLFMRQFEFISWGQGGVYSFQIGSMKPDPPIYAAAREMIPFSPEQVLFIDDLPQNVSGGREAGFTSIHFTGYDDLCQTLERDFNELWGQLCD